jgi:hypothetical protein
MPMWGSFCAAAHSILPRQQKSSDASVGFGNDPDLPDHGLVRSVAWR